ncbi:RhuM family protein [Xenophilus sp. Marseille-Q4582]|uniref:RhuM family protein n=1 Tax=Xenophilus sp. Marseille-Q4582 TaxID=2866600 RepID=UPI00351D3F94
MNAGCTCACARYFDSGGLLPHTAGNHPILPFHPEQTAFAVTGKTAAELIAERADSRRPNMGLTTWESGNVLEAEGADASVRALEDAAKALAKPGRTWEEAEVNHRAFPGNPRHCHLLQCTSIRWRRRPPPPEPWPRCACVGAFSWRGHRRCTRAGPAQSSTRCCPCSAAAPGLAR